MAMAYAFQCGGQKVFLQDKKDVHEKWQ